MNAAIDAIAVQELREMLDELVGVGRPLVTLTLEEVQLVIALLDERDERLGGDDA